MIIAGIVIKMLLVITMRVVMTGMNKLTNVSSVWQQTSVYQIAHNQDEKPSTMSNLKKL